MLTTLRQLRHLKDTTLQITACPADAQEAIQFWLLPHLSDNWAADKNHFRADGWSLCFSTNEPANTATLIAQGDICCPFLSARWVHAAMLGLERGEHRVWAPSQQGSTAFEATSIHLPPHAPIQQLPSLPVIATDADWQEALSSPIGAKLQKAWEQEAG